jgi:hypothetical protein
MTTTETGNALASENCHWYDKDGTPRYSVIGKNGKERPTNIKDAKENGWLPSVTNILNVAAKPGLQKWKLQQMLHAALTLPRIEGETDDAFAERVIEDSEAQSKKAAEKGTELHAAIEQYIQETAAISEWDDHILAVTSELLQYGIDLKDGKAEHSFASPLGFGGKLDWHDDNVLIDFKTKNEIIEGKQLAWPEHCWQLAAYANGLSHEQIDNTPLINLPVLSRRIINVFVGVSDRKVRIHEWSQEDAERGWDAFLYLLNFWQITKNFGRYSKNRAKP